MIDDKDGLNPNIADNSRDWAIRFVNGKREGSSGPRHFLIKIHKMYYHLIGTPKY